MNADEMINKAVDQATEPITMPTPEEFRAMRQELEALKAQQSRVAELEVENATLKVAATARQSSGTVPLNSGYSEAQRQRAVAAAGGPAKWHSISPNKRCEILGVPNAEQVSDAEVREVFGLHSSSLVASRLAKENPTKYKVMRTIARERGIL